MIFLNNFVMCFRLYCQHLLQTPAAGLLDPGFLLEMFCTYSAMILLKCKAPRPTKQFATNSTWALCMTQAANP